MRSHSPPHREERSKNLPSARGDTKTSLRPRSHSATSGRPETSTSQRSLAEIRSGRSKTGFPSKR